MTDTEIDAAQIRHINLSGDMYSLLVYGEEKPNKNYLFQIHPYQEKSIKQRLLHKLGYKKKNYIKPEFRAISNKQTYIYIVSLWGDPVVRKSIIEKLYEMRDKYKNIIIVGYWSDPAFELDMYSSYKFDLLVTSQRSHAAKWKNTVFLHVPVASLGLLKKNIPKKFECFSVGTYSEFRLNRIIETEAQFKKSGITGYYCVAGIPEEKQNDKAVKDIRAYRQFPDSVFLAPRDTLEMCKSANVLLNISRLPKSYETNPSYYAVMFNKKLIIDTDTIKDTEYYDERYMKVVDFAQSDWLSPELVSWIKKTEDINYNYKGEWEPEKFYGDIRKVLKERLRA